MAELNFYEWTQEVNKAIRKRTLKAGRNISLEEHDDKTIIHSDFDGGGGGGSEGYYGPFKVLKLTDTSVKVLGYNALESRFFRNFIILGLTRIEMAEANVNNITASGHVYVEIVFNVNYFATAKYALSLPNQSNTLLIQPIAFVQVNNAKISEIIQYQYGIIHFAGRAL